MEGESNVLPNESILVTTDLQGGQNLLHQKSEFLQMSKAPCLVLHYDSYHIHGRINLILSLQIQNPVAVSFKHEQYANLIRHRFFHVLSYQSTALSHLQIFLIFQLWRVGPLDFYREGNNSTYESDWKKRKDMVSGLTRNTHLFLPLPW